MKVQAECTVLLTGASGGLGTHMTYALAARRTNLVLVAHPGLELENLGREVEARGGRAISFSFDLRDPALRWQLLREVADRIGPIDLLINNAGVEFTAAYHDLVRR